MVTETRPSLIDPPPPGAGEPPQKNQPLAPGTTAPDFNLSSSMAPKVALSDLRGRPVVIAFYPADWSPVCTDQLSIYQMVMPQFEKYNAQVLGISVDSVWSHIAWAKNRNLAFPLLADFEPKGAVARSYNSYRLPEGVSERSLYVIDSNGKVFWSYISPISVNPGADGILRALEELHDKEQSA